MIATEGDNFITVAEKLRRKKKSNFKVFKLSTGPQGRKKKCSGLWVLQNVDFYEIMEILPFQTPASMG